MRRTMTLPNLLTVFRILLIPLFLNLLIYGYYAGAFSLFLAAALTDGLDGLIARVANQRSRLGEYLDPTADKVLLAAAFIELAVLNAIPRWVTVIVVSRDLILILGTLIMHLTQSRFDISPSLIGKGTTLAQILFVILVLFLSMLEQESAGVLNRYAAFSWPVLLITVGLTICSGLHYIYRGVRLMNTPT